MYRNDSNSEFRVEKPPGSDGDISLKTEVEAAGMPPPRSTSVFRFNPSWPGSGNLRTVLLGLILFGLTLWTFYPATRNDFVGYDDPDYVTENRQVQEGVTWAGIQWAFLGSQAANWHPLTWLSHMLDCQIYGLQPWGHHLTSVLLHALNVLLAFLVLRLMSGSTWRSLTAVTLWGVHPLRVESVAWVAERKDVLSTTFWMLTLWTYARMAMEPNARHFRFRFFHGLALAFFILGLMCKPMLVTLPCVLLLLDYWPLNRFARKSVRALMVEKIPFFLAALAVSVITFAVQRRAGAINTSLSMVLRLENALVSYGRYLGKLFCPVDLAVSYPHPGSWPTGVVILAGLLLLAISFAALWWRRQYPFLPVGWLWFVGTLVPTIGLVQLGEQSMADRYTYVPSFGVFLLAAWGIHQATSRWRYQRFALSVLFLAATLLCLGLTKNQIRCWKDSETLFQHALDVTKGNYLVHNNLGMAFLKHERFAEAATQFQEATRERPNYYQAHVNLGAAFEGQGRLVEALNEFQEALRERPGNPEMHKNIGIILGEQGHLPEAGAQFQEALRENPNYAEAHDAWGTALQAAGQSNEAIGHYREAVRLKPDYADAHSNLGGLLARQNRVDEAIIEFQQAINLRPDPNAFLNLGVALEQKGLLDEAINQFRKAIQLKPDQPNSHLNLGVALCQKGMFDDGMREFQEALRLKPDYTEARNNIEYASSLMKSRQAPVVPAQP